MKSILTILSALFAGSCLAADQPNVVLVITDDQGYGDLGCAGNPIVKTPHLDKLANESVWLDDYHVAPTCSPTRCALLTGHWTNRTGVWHTIMGRSMLRENEITLGQLLSDAGYETGMFGKWHLGDNYPYRPEDRGFTEVYRHGGGGVGQTPDVWDNSYFDGGYFHNGKIVPAKGFCTDVFFEQGNAFIRKCVEAKKPFFAYISTNAPHGPLHAPQKYLDMYQDQKINLASFFGMITNVDDNVGATRSLLEELGVYEDTIFIFTTDNGTAGGARVFNAGMRGQKGSEYDGGHRVPLFLHWPAGGMGEKKVVDRLVHAVDIVPTLLDLCGASKPADLNFDGKSIRPLLTGDGSDWPDRFMVTDSQRVVDPIKWRKTAVMSEEWRLVNGKELYRIDEDPGQKNDVAAEHPEQVAKMTEFYDAWWAELEPTFSQTTEIYLGAPGHDVVSLNGHDWIGERVSPPWNQGHIRRAAGAFPARPRKNQKAQAPKLLKHEGHWAVKVITDGEYDIALRRWPAEADKPIVAALPAGENVPGASLAFRANDGVAIPVVKATLRINGEEIASKPVGETDTHITFTTSLTKGSHELSPVFHLESGSEVGAYYTVVTKR